jgi:hypothetical protein
MEDNHPSSADGHPGHGDLLAGIDLEKRSDQQLLLRALRERWPITGEGKDRQLIVQMLKSRIQRAYERQKDRSLTNLVKCLAELDKLNIVAEQEAAAEAVQEHVTYITHDPDWYGNAALIEQRQAEREESGDDNGMAGRDEGTAGQ